MGSLQWVLIPPRMQFNNIKFEILLPKLLFEQS